MVGALTLRGERVVLRSFRPEEYDIVNAEHEGRVSERDAAAELRFRERFDRSGELVNGWLDLGIEAEGRLVGDVGARRPPGAFPPGVFELGIDVYDAADRGKGYGTDAIRVVTGYLFESMGAERVQATTAVGNDAMRRVLERTGFVSEGTLRAFMPGPDGREDYAMYAVTRKEWAGRKSPARERSAR